MNELQSLIKKTELKNKRSSFTVSTRPSVDDIFHNSTIVEITYSEDDLTKNYVKFLTDVFHGKFGKVTESQITALGDTIKADVSDFKASYLKKKSVIKEITQGIFIHTSMNSETMRVKIKNVVDSFNGQLTWPKTISEEISHGTILGNDLINSDTVLKRMYVFQLEKESIEDKLNRSITPSEFKRFIKDFDAKYFTHFFKLYDYNIRQWKHDSSRYKSDESIVD